MSSPTRTTDVGRPRRFSNEDIFAATTRAIAELGYRELSLSAIASRVGCAKGTLIQRFQSREGLIRAYLTWHAERTSEEVQHLLASSNDPLTTLHHLLTIHATSQVHGFGEGASHTPYLLFFAEGRGLPGVREAIDAHALRLEQDVALLLGKASDQGHIRPHATGELAHLVLAAVSGAMLLWSPAAPRTLGEELERVMRCALAPYVIAD